MDEPMALVLSAVIEFAIAALIVHLTKWPSRGALHVGLASAVATAVTHPQAWNAALWAYPHLSYWPATLGIETAVIAIEGLLIAWIAALKFRSAMLVSLLANLSSFFAGWYAGI